ncbi:MAG TPA: leucine--tRNA ligase [Polyangia bacterium]|nr:leucine--tRNA ligase [Polyangia bacterium]
MADETEDKYTPAELEPRWQKKWAEAGVFRAVRDPAKKKYFVLEMFPYPSGRLHMGHVRNYSIGDVVARTRRMMGYSVLYPMGWDAFGLPAENAAIKAKVHPREWTLQNIKHMREQFLRLGLSYDWSREITTCEPDYFVHEQRIFIEMWKRGLAYRKGAVVNWCPSCQTVLANEQVEDGLCWRCRSVVQQRELEQWFLKVTEYADELLADVKQLEGKWPDKVLRMQENWIGRSEGARLRFPFAGGAIEVFTTRPDTLCGVTFISIAAEHPLVKQASAEARAFAAEVAKEDKIKRGSEDYEKRGVDTGLRCTHPITGGEIPIWIANFVLMDYGTGAVMAVPAHDQRDFEFANKYGLPIRIVIQPEGEKLDSSSLKEAYTGPGVMVDSGEFNGNDNETAKALITAKAGEKTVSYRIRDWLVSRQRFWGAPIPMVKCATHGYQPVPEAELPVELPADVTLAEGGQSPLATHPTWKQTKCPTCGGPAERETDTMDGFMESSWYPLRFASPRDDGKWLAREDVDYWMPVDQYIGGAEHATKHLIYARFFTKMLRDWGWVAKDLDEPFTRLLTQGMVVKETYSCPEHGYLFPDDVTKERTHKNCGQPVTVGRIEKMSKSLNNVVEPLPLIEKYGADTVRVFSLFAAPPDSMLEWSEAGVEGAWRFLNRVWRLVIERPPSGAPAPSAELRQKTHATIKKVTDDVGGERFHFNTAIAAIMELVNAVYAEPAADRAEAAEAIVLMLTPIAPHLAEELWHRLGHDELVVTHAWPAFDPAIAQRKTVAFPVQVNGKLRGQVEAEPGAEQAKIDAAARELQTVRAALDGKQIVKVVFVPGRLINFVVR